MIGIHGVMREHAQGTTGSRRQFPREGGEGVWNGRTESFTFNFWSNGAGIDVYKLLSLAKAFDVVAFSGISSIRLAKGAAANRPRMTHGHNATHTKAFDVLHNREVYPMFTFH